MNLATWSIRNPVPTLLLFIFMAGAGVWGLRSLGMQTFPDIDFPLITVNLAQPGAAPAQRFLRRCPAVRLRRGP